MDSGRKRRSVNDAMKPALPLCAFPMLLWAQAPHPLKCRAECEWCCVSHFLCDCAHGFVRSAQQVRRQCHSPVLEKGHRRFADKVLETTGKGRPRRTSLGSERIERPGPIRPRVHQAKRPFHNSVALLPPPLGAGGVASTEPRFQHRGQQQIEQSIQHGSLARFVLDHLVSQQRDDGRVPVIMGNGQHRR